MAKKKPKGSYKVEKVMHEFKEGSLRSSSGSKVTNPKQAIAIGLSEQRQLEKKSLAYSKLKRRSK